MAAFRQYILTVLCGAMICAVAPLFVGEGKKPLRLICGVFLTVTVVAPILRIDLGEILTEVLPDQTQFQQPAEEGASMARDSIAQSIKASLEAYILDKAQVPDLSVSVLLSEDDLPTPVGVELRGTVSEEERQRLTKIITEDLGIPEEAQRWTG